MEISRLALALCGLYFIFWGQHRRLQLAKTAREKRRVVATAIGGVLWIFLSMAVYHYHLTLSLRSPFVRQVVCVAR